MANGEMPPDLLVGAGLCIQDDQRKRAVARPGRHIARVLFMARTVGDDEPTPARGKITVGNVDRYSLLALALETIEQQRKVEFFPARAILPAIVLQRRQL